MFRFFKVLSPMWQTWNSFSSPQANCSSLTTVASYSAHPACSCLPGFENEQMCADWETTDDRSIPPPHHTVGAIKRPTTGSFLHIKCPLLRNNNNVKCPTCVPGGGGMTPSNLFVHKCHSMCSLTNTFFTILFCRSWNGWGWWRTSSFTKC